MRGRTVGGHLVRDEAKFVKTLGKEGRTVVQEVSGQEIGSTVRPVSGRSQQVALLQVVSGADSLSGMPGRIVRDRADGHPPLFRGGSVPPVLSAHKNRLGWVFAVSQSEPRPQEWNA